VYGDLILAPMDGYSGWPFRSVCRELGSAMSYTEFVNAIEILNGHPYVHRKLIFRPEERPVVFQLFDADEDRLLEAARRLQDLGPDAIDINLGCSARHVSARGAGSGLLREPEKVALIFRSLTQALRLPVTAKMRLGWDESSRNYLEIAHIIEDNGGAAIAVHGRTRQQAYRGEADWEAIGELRQAVRVPVIANGDVRTAADIERIKAVTGCPAVMIGRAAVGNPWIFSRLDAGGAGRETLLATMHCHLERSLEFYGPRQGLLRFRKHAQRYLAPYAISKEQHDRLMTAETVEGFWGVLEAAV
jgi:nifR3 family TIM-barrel protein